MGFSDSRIPQELMLNERAHALFSELFGDDFQTPLARGFVTGVSEDGLTLGLGFQKQDGSMINVSLPCSLIGQLMGCLAVGLQHSKDRQALIGPPQGRA